MIIDEFKPFRVEILKHDVFSNTIYVWCDLQIVKRSLHVKLSEPQKKERTTTTSHLSDEIHGTESLMQSSNYKTVLVFTDRFSNKSNTLCKI